MSALEPYAELHAILIEALADAASGKGAERHGLEATPFAEQPMMAISKMVGVGFPLGQAMKKTQEAARFAKRSQRDAARRELIGAIVYLAGAVLALDAEKREGKL